MSWSMQRAPNPSPCDVQFRGHAWLVWGCACAPTTRTALCIAAVDVSPSSSMLDCIRIRREWQCMCVLRATPHHPMYMQLKPTRHICFPLACDAGPVGILTTGNCTEHTHTANGTQLCVGCNDFGDQVCVTVRDCERPCVCVCAAVHAWLYVCRGATGAMRVVGRC